jgi:lipoic acid synthetase
METPEWIKEAIPRRKLANSLKRKLNNQNLNTVCEEAKCPNIGDCFKRGTATFMIMGNICTRNCAFCAVKNGKPEPLDYGEPSRIAKEVKNLELKHVVITSPSRDDIQDEGAFFYSITVRETKRINPDATVEVLIPDFNGKIDSLKKVIDSGIDVLNHNIETVSRLYPVVRPKSNYKISLNILKESSRYSQNLTIKSGLMLGLGELKEEVISVMNDLLSVNCNIITIGQYLRPSKKHLPVTRYVSPEEFREYKDIGEDMGFDYVASAPLVRSSYHAEEAFNISKSKRDK